MKKLFILLIMTILLIPVSSCKKEAKDVNPPVITLLGYSPVAAEKGQPYVDAGATALDDVDGDITAKIEVINLVNTDVEGSYTVTYNVSDEAGNKAAEVVRTVNVMIF